MSKLFTKTSTRRAGISFVAGWWGFPFGLILTPIQLIRNFIAMSHAAPGIASPELKTIVLRNLAAQLAQQEAGQLPQRAHGFEVVMPSNGPPPLAQTAPPELPRNA